MTTDELDALRAAHQPMGVEFRPVGASVTRSWAARPRCQRCGEPFRCPVVRLLDLVASLQDAPRGATGRQGRPEGPDSVSPGAPGRPGPSVAASEG